MVQGNNEARITGVVLNDALLVGRCVVSKEKQFTREEEKRECGVQLS